ncbi:hypothetical protein D1007_25312 [Hordeum vulgare]|nr:hypothetical protein D1007_25312 [Hordeum vulgare]
MPPLPPPGASSLCFPRSPRRWAHWADDPDPEDMASSDGDGRLELPVSLASPLLGSFLAAARPARLRPGKEVGRRPPEHCPPVVPLLPSLARAGVLPGLSHVAAAGEGPREPRPGAGALPLVAAASVPPAAGDARAPAPQDLLALSRRPTPRPLSPCPAGRSSPPTSSLLACTAGGAPSSAARRPDLLPIPSPRRSYRDMLMTCHARDGQARPKRPLPAEQGLLPTPTSRDQDRAGLEALPAARDRAPDGGAASSRSGRGGAARSGKSPEYYFGTSLRRPPPPRDPERDPRLPLPGSSGDRRRPEAARAADLDRETSLRAELVTRLTPASQPREEPTPREPPARDLAHRPAAPSWRRDRQDHRRGERWGGPPMRRGDDGRWVDWRSSRAEGADWRRDDGPSRHVSPDALPAAPLPAPAPAKKKKKSKKKKRSREDTMCINCGCAGHYRSECEAPPRCPTTLAYLGYGTERGSFYFVDAEIEEVAARPHLATVTLEPGQPIPDGLVISSDLIRDELAAYIGDFRDSKFAWEVTETAPLVFSVPFPSAELLRVCSHGPIRCPLNQLLISVQAATSEPDPVPPLEKVWVLVYGLPRGAVRLRGVASSLIF